VKSVRRTLGSTTAKYVGIVVALALVVAIVPGASKGSVSSQANAKRASFTDVVVSPSGRIGPINGRHLMVGRSTEADVIKAEKRKPNTRSKVMGRAGVVGRNLEYQMRIAGSKTTCTREYDFPRSAGRLNDFESNCRYLRTSRGIRVGMSAATAEGLAGQTAVYSPDLGHGCMIEGHAIVEQQGSNWLVAWMRKVSDFSVARYGPVGGIAFYSASSTFWGSTCS
jgi:hypothetical protein